MLLRFISTPTTSAVFHYLRAHLPAKHLGHELKDHGIALTAGPMPKEIDPADCYVVGNIPDPKTIGHLQHIKSKGAIIVMHLDDDHHTIPDSNPAKEQIDKFALQCLDYALEKLADCIFVTTVHLASKMPTGKRVFILPNLIDINDYPPFAPKTSQDVLWAGSPTHWEDLELIERIPEQQPNRQFRFMGQLPPACASVTVPPGRIIAKTSSKLPNVNLFPPVLFPRYQNVISALAAKSGIGICPLDKTEFNLSKSNLKMLEWFALGLSVVASDWGPYREAVASGAPAILCNTEAEWLAALDNPKEPQQGYDWVKANGSWQSGQRHLWWDALIWIAKTGCMDVK